MRNLQAHLAVFISTIGCRSGQVRATGLRHPNEAAIDMLQGTESYMGQQRRENKRAQNCDARKSELALEARGQFAAQENCRDADMNAAKWLAVQDERKMNVVNGRRVINHPEFLPEICLLQL